VFTCNGQTFETVAVARRVVGEGWTHVPAAGTDADGNIVGGCHFLIPNARYDFDGMPMVGDCGAEAAYNDDHFECSAGHEYTSAETREREGWDYAGDERDAAAITRAGKAYVPMGPSTAIDVREAARMAAF
jgi:hypothetical protein